MSPLDPPMQCRYPALQGQLLKCHGCFIRSRVVPPDVHVRSSSQGSALLLYPRTSQKPGLSSVMNSMPLTHFALFHP